MKRNLYKLIKEQFSLSDLDFSDDEEYNDNIFDKNVIDPEKVYNNIINGIDVEDEDIQNLDKFVVSLYPVKNNSDLNKIIKYYSLHYPNNSLNWLDVS